jgi:ubiquitin-protein ligase
LQDKYPYQPPQLFCKTNFVNSVGQPTLFDGRDLLQDLLMSSDEAQEWKPQMTIKQLVEMIPTFLGKINQLAFQKIGRYHIGKDYDIQLFQHNPQHCHLYACQQTVLEA